MLAFYLFCLLAGSAPGDDLVKADTLVVCPADFESALQPWIEYRRRQGHQILVRPPMSTATELRGQIRSLAGRHPLKNIVLVGDSADQYSTPERLVPTDYVAAKVNVKFGGDFEIATDNTFADIDDDGMVDLTIGRIPVDTPAELTRFIHRVMEYERDESAGEWQRRINFVAGVGGFGKLIDSMIEQSAKRIVTDLIPPQYNITMTYGNWRSPWCPDPRRFSSTAIDRFNEGCLFWVYIGHGNRECLDQVRLPDRRCDILDNHSVARIAVTDGAPIAIFLSCYTAATDAAIDGLAENMIRQPHGPIAAISSSNVSMPYAMSIFSLELIDGYFGGQANTLGELVLHSKRGMNGPARPESEYHELIESMGRTFSPEPDLLRAEKLEHVQLMHLLGDPLLRLKCPARIELQSPESARPGDLIAITGSATVPGEMTIELAYRRDRFRGRPPRRRQYDSTDESFDAYNEAYRQSQAQVCATVSSPVVPGPFAMQLRIPKSSNGNCHIRAMLVGAGHLGLASNDIMIEAEPGLAAPDREP